MRRIATALWTATLLLLLGSGATRADVIFSLQSDRPLTGLGVGDTVTFTVGVNLTGGEVLDTLTAGILFPSGFFSLSPGSAGSIIPVATDFASTTGFDMPPGVDFVDGSFFLPLPGDEITISGPFFTFTATTLKVGEGHIAFDPLATSAFLVGAGSARVVLPAAQPFAIVPEPTTLLIWTGLMIGGVVAGRGRAARVVRKQT